MKELPIPFSAEMVRALMREDTPKTQTRRIAQFVPREGANLAFSGLTPGNYFTGRVDSGWVLHSRGDGGCLNERTEPLCCPYGVPGDRLWVREAWRAPRILNASPPRDISPDQRVHYEADGHAPYYFHGGRYRHGRFMPRWASRLTLEVTVVRVERLREITDADCVAEGCSGGHGSIPGYGYNATPFEHYKHVWESINGPGSWDANPWVWVIEFKRLAT